MLDVPHVRAENLIVTIPLYHEHNRDNRNISVPQRGTFSSLPGISELMKRELDSSPLVSRFRKPERGPTGCVLPGRSATVVRGRAKKKRERGRGEG